MAKHQEISKELRSEIAAGIYARDGKLPSEAQLVDRFGVSRPTVARALRDLQMEGLIERRAGSGSFIRSTEVSSTADIIGFLVPERRTIEIFEAICGEIGGLARAGGYGVLWGGSPMPFEDRDASPQHARDVCAQYVDKEVSGVFFAPYEHVEDKDSLNRELLGTLRQSGIPVVLLDRDVTQFPMRSDFDLVCLDNYAAGFMIAEHLIRLGCHDLRFVTRPESAPTVDARICGTREALIRYSIDVSNQLVLEGDPTSKEFAAEIVETHQAKGVICANDATAVELIQTLEKRGKKVPEHVRVVGFDDVRYATVLSVPLTTVHQPCRELAEVAFHAMQERIEQVSIPPRKLVVSPRLVVRETCGAYHR